MNAMVVGAGRMGLPLACVLAGNGAAATVCDINPALVRQINEGLCPYEEPGLAALLDEVHQEGRLRATLDTTQAARDADVIIVIVPAHLTNERDIDYAILKDAAARVGEGLQPGALVIFETTVSVGGTRHELVPVLEDHSGLKAGRDFHVAFSPERVKANLVLERLRKTPKVVGGYDQASCAKAVAFYSLYLGAPVHDVRTLEAAEMAKLADMLYRDVSIALANELAEFAEAVGVDFEVVRRAANTSGEAHLLAPGIGVGGHCTPVYPYFLTRAARRLGVGQRLAETARAVNDAQPARHVARVAQAWQPLANKRAHILGLAFRPGVKVDIFSSAYALRDELIRHGAIVTLQDPHYSSHEILCAGFRPADVDRDRADVVFLNTAHEEFASPDFAAWAAGGISVVVDGRDFWDPLAAARAGLLYLGTGRRTLGIPKDWSAAMAGGCDAHASVAPRDLDG